MLAAVIAGLAMAMSLLLLDLWRAVVAREAAQAAADAAALAAAGAIAAGTGASPLEAARAYAAANGAVLESCACDEAAGEAVVTVRVTFHVGLTGGGDRTVRARARAVVEGPTPSGSAAEGLQGWFVARLECLFDRVDGITVVSGYRTAAEQARLYREKPGLAAPPGKSLHEAGLAADLAFPSASARALAHAVAPACGLGFDVPGEPWHVAPAGLE